MELGYQDLSAITEMVPDLIWAPDFFGPREIWSSRNVGPTKFGSGMKMLYNDFHEGTKFLGAQSSQGPNFSGTKKVRDPNEAGDYFDSSLFLSSLTLSTSLSTFLAAAIFFMFFKN